MPGIPVMFMDRSDRLQGCVLGDRYVFLYVIGRGAVADVYLARDRKLMKNVAIKILRKECAGDGRAMARFRREAKALRYISHPNIVELIDAGRTHEGDVYLVLEFLVGRDLEVYIAQEAPIPPRSAAGMMAALCRGLVAIHEKGVIHRDIKPANIFVVEQPGKPLGIKLLDFGISRALGIDPHDDALAGGKMLGSVCYVAPEQAQRLELDEQVDLYAVGAIFFELLSGHPPYDHEDPLEVLRMHVQEPIPPLGSDMPAAFRALCYQLMSKEREARPANAEVAQEAFRVLAVQRQ